MDQIVNNIGCKVFFWVLLLWLPLSSQGQYHCLTGEHVHESLLQQRAQFLQALDQWYTGKTSLRSTERIYIPVVFHVVFNNPEENISEEKLLQQLDRLNRDFSFTNMDTSEIPDGLLYLVMDSGIRFCLATQDPDGNPSNGITRTQTNTDIIGLRTSNGRRHVFYEDLGGKNIWDSRRYLNIYICDMGEMGGLGARPYTAIAAEDGVVLNYKFTGVNESESFNLGRIGTHEVGHYFNLEHTWGSLEGCPSDDGVRDTPRQFGPYFGCPSLPQISCESEDVFFTFMDFVDDPCMHLFTAGQINRMLSSIILARPQLMGSSLCDAEDSTSQHNSVVIYPNPISAGSLIVSFGVENESLESFELFNASGKLVDSGQAARSNWLAIPIETIASGVYILILYSDHGSYSRKFVKLD